MATALRLVLVSKVRVPPLSHAVSILPGSRPILSESRSPILRQCATPRARSEHPSARSRTAPLRGARLSLATIIAHHRLPFQRGKPLFPAAPETATAACGQPAMSRGNWAGRGARASTIRAPGYTAQNPGITADIGLRRPCGVASRSPPGGDRQRDRETGRRYVPFLRRCAGRTQSRQKPRELPTWAVPGVTDECGKRGGPQRAGMARRESSATRLDSNLGPCIIRQALPHRNRAGKGARRLDRVVLGGAGQHRMHQKAKGHLA